MFWLFTIPSLIVLYFVGVKFYLLYGLVSGVFIFVFDYKFLKNYVTNNLEMFGLFLSYVTCWPVTIIVHSLARSHDQHEKL